MIGWMLLEPFCRLFGLGFSKTMPPPKEFVDLNNTTSGDPTQVYLPPITGSANTTYFALSKTKDLPPPGNRSSKLEGDSNTNSKVNT